MRRPGATAALGALTVALLVAAALCARAAGSVTGAAQVAAYVLTVAAAALSADVIVRTVFDVGMVRRWASAPPPADREASDAASTDDAVRVDDAAGATGTDDSADAGRPGPLRGGLAIGVLERTAVTVAVLAGWPGGIAVVLAVKGLARYPELREPDASEQFIIGTFTSVLFSLAVAGVGIMLVR
nr:hypothetical protein [Tomitella gaofuii]